MHEDGQPVVTRAAGFRHDPVKAVVPMPGDLAVPDWRREPVVCGYRLLSYHNKTLNQDIAVPVSATPAVIGGIGVVVAADDGYVRFHSRDLSKVFWERRLNSGVYASLVVDATRRRVVVAATNGLIVCFDLKGRLVWSADAGVPVFATPTVLPQADVLVVAGFHGRCLGLELATGEKVFDRTLPRPWHDAHGGSASYRDPYASPAATEADTAIVGCAEHVLCLAADGTTVWERRIGHSVRASPAVVHATGEVAVLPVTGECVFLDSATGEKVASLRLGSKPTASPAVSGTVLAVGTQDDVTTGIDVHTHEIRWRSTQGGPRSYTSLSVLPDGAFIAANARGNVLCLSRDDGAFRWESSQVLGLPDHDPALDITPVAGPDGALYCASYSGVLYYFAFPPTAEEQTP
jgi:outer membrane protein assembly factor BamB